MKRTPQRLVSGFVASGLCLGLTLASSGALGAEENLEEVIVTGSHIKGTPEDAALPVDVFTRTDLEDDGLPSINEMVRNLNVSSSALAETNQFDGRGGQANEGVSTVNLRGLGSARTLVLINSKRHVATESLGVDISAMPTTAIGRVEVLKDGAAALYGSDAIGGVVNFITRGNFEGLELRGSHQSIQDSNGDNSLSAIYGTAFGSTNFAVSAEYNIRSELHIRDRDWSLRPWPENPAPGGWSSIGNPGALFPAIAGDTGPMIVGTPRPDPNCNELGGYQQSWFCRFQYTFYDNLIEDETNIKVFGEINTDISDTMTLHAEMLWHQMEMPEWDTSPSYPPQALLGPDRFVPHTHPGLMAMKEANPGMFAGIPATIPVSQVGALTWSRMLGVYGRNGEPETGIRKTGTMRASFGLAGEFGGTGYDVSLSWSERQRDISGSDMYIERMAFALDGLGGAGCDPATGSPGVGSCEYYNPFSNALPRSAVTGQANPHYNADVANSPELIDWLTAATGSYTTNTQLVMEGILNGQLGFEMGGGVVGWAAGAQLRQDDYNFEVEDVANRSLNPCPFNNQASVTLGHTPKLDCGAGGAGQLAFLAATDEEETSRSVYGVFGELLLPITNTLEVQVAFRFEDYGEEDGGNSFDPKIAVRWDALEQLTFRGSASTTFRGPPASFLSGTGTSLQFVTPATAFKAVDTTGTADLEPETALALNLGAIVQTEIFYGSLDYWSFDFEKPFQVENNGQLVAAYIANGCQNEGAGVGTPACDLLRGRITPEGTAAAGIQRIQVYIINGADIKTSGLDFVARLSFNELTGSGSTLDAGLEGTYMLEYTSDDFVLRNGFKLRDGDDFVGRSNEGTPFTPKPRLKANIFVRWGLDQHRVNYVARFVSGYDDQAPDTPSSLRQIPDFLTHDITYVNGMLSLSIFNMFDKSPPRVANDLNYDPYNHSPFGRMIKLGFTYRLGQ